MSNCLPDFFISVNEDNSCRAFGPFGFNFEFEELGNIFEYLIPVVVFTVDFKEVVAVNLLDLFQI